MRKASFIAALGVFLAAASARADAVLLAAGDIAGCAWTKDTDTADLVKGLSGTVLALGDLAYQGGTDAEFTDCYAPTWGAFKSRTKPVPGNHEYRTGGAAGFYNYFANLPEYYKFSPTPGWSVYALNNYVPSGAGSAQAVWFENQLEADPNRCQLVYWHEPYVSSGHHGSSSRPAALFAIAYRYKVEIGLAGHEHSYERFGQMNPSRRVEAGRGVRLFVVGTGGVPQRAFGAVRAGSVKRANGHGVLRLTLRDAGGYAWSFRNAAGSSISDSGSGACLT